MAEPTTVAAADTSTAPASTGAAAGGDIAQTIAQAVAAAVQTSMSQIDQKLASISENISKISSGFDTSITGTDDAYTEQRRSRDFYEQLRQASLVNFNNMIETANAMGKQMVRHGDVAVARHWGTDPVQVPTPKTA